MLKSLIMAGIVLGQALHCFSQSEDIELDVLVPTLEDKDYGTLVQLIGGDFKIRSIGGKHTFLPLKINSIATRMQGAILFDKEGHRFPVLKMAPPDVRKIAAMKTLREVVDLLTGTDKETSKDRIFVCEENALPSMLQGLRAGVGSKVRIEVAYVSGGRVTTVACVCTHLFAKKGTGLDTPFRESSVSTWISQKFPVEPIRNVEKSKTKP